MTPGWNPGSLETTPPPFPWSESGSDQNWSLRRWGEPRSRSERGCRTALAEMQTFGETQFYRCLPFGRRAAVVLFCCSLRFLQASVE
jgi:hypothetical protein